MTLNLFFFGLENGSNFYLFLLTSDRQKPFSNLFLNHLITTSSSFEPSKQFVPLLNLNTVTLRNQLIIGNILDFNSNLETIPILLGAV